MYKVFINDKQITFESPLSSKKLISSEAHQYQMADLINKIKCSAKGIKHNIIINTDRPFQSFSAFTKEFRKIGAAGGIVCKSKTYDAILMIHRLGKWDLPKGKTEKGETIMDSAIREVEEECGIRKLKITRKLMPTYHLYVIKNEWVIKKTSWFLMVSTDSGELIPQQEEGIKEARWVARKGIEKYLQLSYASIAHLIRSELSGR